MITTVTTTTTTATSSSPYLDTGTWTCTVGTSTDTRTDTAATDSSNSSSPSLPLPLPRDHNHNNNHISNINLQNTYHSEFVERPRGLDVGESGLEVLELEVDLLLGGLRVADGLDLEGVDGLELALDVVGGGLEVLEAALDLVDDGLVLQDGPVVGEVDGRGLLRQRLQAAPRRLVALLEGLQRRRRLAPQAQRRRHLDPVELEGCASWLLFLRKERRKEISSKLVPPQSSPPTRK